MSAARRAGEHASLNSPLPTAATEIDLTSPGERAEGFTSRTNTTRWLGFIGGFVLAAALWLAMPQDVPHDARLTAAIAGLMAVWWMTEAIPIPVTALVPLVAFPILADGTEEAPVTVSSVGASYGADTIFLFMGGFMIALAMQRWNLHRRIALLVLAAMGDRTQALIGGFMIATGFLSMWISNTATAVLMLPIGLSVLTLVTEAMERDGVIEKGGGLAAVVQTKFGAALMLAIAYSASIGSLGTLIGTPPNAFLNGYLEQEFGIDLGFGRWMLVGVPLALVMMVAAWFLIAKVLFKPEVARIPGGRAMIRAELAKLGPTSTGEKLVLVIFALAALSWILVPTLFDPAPISDAGIALVAGVLLFILPAGAARGVRLLDWESAVKLPWGVLLLFGGGLALAGQFSSSGLTTWIGEVSAQLGTLPVILIVVILATAVIFLTEITSNTATAATFVPLVGGVAVGIGQDPLLLTIPVALAATCAFMLPVATPPNAVVFGSGYVTIGQMIKGGVWLNVIGIVLVSTVTLTLAAWVFGIAY
ncbi:SLC13 family permease [Microbacterium halophytorum]|uniref:SLC13 family permease n=1 Tax=Microbacterium halophytorum TaxID=2067568 RepID=UPI000CFB0362|nr:DASS family sodium-coupled anion symporter [Microbacterium halophytorum]